MATVTVAAAGAGGAVLGSASLILGDVGVASRFVEAVWIVALGVSALEEAVALLVVLETVAAGVRIKDSATLLGLVVAWVVAASVASGLLGAAARGAGRFVGTGGR